jgi:cytochrome c-type biogenesis protein CcmE
VKPRYLIAAVVCLGAVVWMVTSLGANIDYWKPVQQAVHDRHADRGKHLRVGGLVVPGSIHGRDFQLSDGKATLLVRLGSADAPQTVRGCAPLVVAGRWQGRVLVADELTRRHGSDYSSKQHPLADDTPVSACRSGSA